MHAYIYMFLISPTFLLKKKKIILKKILFSHTSQQFFSFQIFTNFVHLKMRIRLHIDV